MNLDYLIDNWRRVLDLTVDHLQLSLVAMGIALLIAIPLGILVATVKPLSLPVMLTLSVSLGSCARYQSAAAASRSSSPARFCSLGIAPRGFGHRQPGLGRQLLHRVHEAQAALVGIQADGVAMRAAAEAVVEALVVVDVEARRLLVVERAAALQLAPGARQLHPPPDDRRSPMRARSSSRKSGGKAHLRTAPPSPAPTPSSCRAAPCRAFTTAITVPMSLTLVAPSFGHDRRDRGLRLLVRICAGRKLSITASSAVSAAASSARPPFSYISIDSRRCLAIFRSTSITSTSSSLGRRAGAQLDVAILELRRGSGGRRPAVPCRRLHRGDLRGLDIVAEHHLSP